MIDRRQHDVAQAVRELTGGAGVDRIIELDIAANAAADIEMIRPDGQWVVYGSGAREFSLPFMPLIAKNIGVRFFIVYNLSAPDRERAIALLQDWLRAGALQHNIAERLPLDEIVAAHARWRGRGMGNVVLQIA